MLATCVYPQLFEFSQIPDDVKKRARIILNGCLGSSMGAYTETKGIPIIRQHIADYIMKRDDGIRSDPNNIFITDGASHIIKVM